DDWRGCIGDDPANLSGSAGRHYPPISDAGGSAETARRCLPEDVADAAHRQLASLAAQLAALKSPSSPPFSIRVRLVLPVRSHATGKLGTRDAEKGRSCPWAGLPVVYKSVMFPMLLMHTGVSLRGSDWAMLAVSRRLALGVTTSILTALRPLNGQVGRLW